MQIELTLFSDEGLTYPASDLGFLLHKHPGHLHDRDVAQGKVSVFFPDVSDRVTRAVIHLDVDPVALVRGKNDQSDGLLAEYVNDRPYAVNSLLSVALGRVIGQTLSGKSKDRQALADRALPFAVRIVPVAVSGGLAVIEELFAPLGYGIEAIALDDSGRRPVFDLTLTTTARLRDILNHLYVLVPVLDNAKHYHVDRAEIDKLLAKGGDWLAQHPAKELIARRSLEQRRRPRDVADWRGRAELHRLRSGRQDAVFCRHADPADRGDGGRSGDRRGRRIADIRRMPRGCP
jgi:3' terminal RNA ribose 2'-O-methyltransferase Hen1